MMRIEHFGGMDEVRDRSSLDRVLSMRFGDEANEFWISGERRHPALALLVHGDVASLQYFPEEGHPGFVCVAEHASQPEGTTVFYVNTPSEELRVSNKAVVPLEEALRVAHDFFVSQELPRGARWIEL